MLLLDNLTVKKAEQLTGSFLLISKFCIFNSF